MWVEVTFGGSLEASMTDGGIFGAGPEAMMRLAIQLW